MRLLLFLCLAGCAPTACERFLEAKAACYVSAGQQDDAPEDYCDDRRSDADPAAVIELYECWTRAYEASACESDADVEAAGSAASACSY